MLLTLLCTSVRAQTTVAVMDFDGTMPEIAVSGSIAFYDGGATAFFGIHDANADDTDGTLADTGVGAVNRTSLVDGAPISGDFFFIVDNNTTQNPTNLSTLTIGPVSVSGQSGLLFSFDYNAFDFDGGEGISYQLDIDGALTDPVEFVDGANGAADVNMDGSLDLPIPDNTNSVSLVLTINQNAQDYVAFDNFIVTADNAGLPCGLTSFGPSATAACVAYTNGIADEYTLSLGYSGSDANGTLALLVDGTPASAFTNNGDDPTTANDGTIDLSSPDLVEGTSYEITFTNTSGSCAYSVTGSVANNTCVSVCDLTVEPIRFFCDDFTAGTDAVSAEIRYFGAEPGVTVTASGGITVSGNDPATEEGGTGAANTRKILLTGLVEGGTYNITISGGACSGADDIVIDATVATDLCLPVGDLVINEFYASPNTGAGEYEFVELYNRGLAVLDISDYSIEEGAGSSIVVPAGTSLNPGEGILMAGSNSATSTDCPVVNGTFIGLNNGGDVIILRDAAGLILQQLTYGAEANVQQSLALSPDGNLDGGYQLHSTISMTGATSSACANNEDNSPLPLELLSFTAAANGKTVLLNWETSLEVNNDRFVVERSNNSRRWEGIGTVMATGESAGTYAFSDENPLDGENYYRLRQFDADDASAIHGLVVVVFSATEFRAYPNPAGNEIYFGGNSAPGKRVSLLDANGRVLRELPAGTNRASLSGMPSGIYLLRVARASGTEVVRFVKK